MKTSSGAGSCVRVTCARTNCQNPTRRRRQRFCSRDCYFRERRRRAEAMLEKQCNDCAEILPIASFSQSVKGLPMSVCRDCQATRVRVRRAANPEKADRISLRSCLRRKFGMTLEHWDALMLEQGGRCAICRKPPREGKRLTVDHCHDTGAIRGLLCGSCNTGLGMFGDDPDRLEMALGYLR